MGEMKLGRELDTLVAAKVVGWKREAIEGEMYLIAPDGAMWAESETHCLDKCLHHYSASIEAAWEVLEKIKTKDRRITVSAPMGDLHWVCQVFENGGIISGAGADTAPHAICLAALRAVGAI